ncbi:MAG: type I-E CRISPR-associated protein Cse1/CasA [Chloroflexi bacterium]|nr:type I-E CRISPR-associated protein Cse1/CasA [Chloroflexota bacterium]
MTASFNLLDRPWIPCHIAGSGATQDLSLLEALGRAQDITGIVADSPLETIAVHRLLLAVLHRNFRIAEPADWSALWEAGRFDAGAIDAWAGAWRHRFDLFDAGRPFYQAPGLPEAAGTTVAKLGHEFSAGNNAVLFDHSWDTALPAIPVAKAARLLLGHQLFAIGGLIGRLPGDPPSAEAAHLVKAAVLLNVGANLFETLLLNMVRVDGAADQPFAFDPAKDAPAWEREPARALPRAPDGYLDLLTWQSRRILLFPNPDDASVSRMALMAGFSFPAGLPLRQFETMAAYKLRANPMKGTDPWAPLGFLLDKALWRDSGALLQSLDETKQVSASLRWLANLRGVGAIDRARTFNLAAFGLSSDRAKVFLWRREELPLPVAYLEEPDLVAALGRAVAAAEDSGKALRSGARLLASETLGPGGTADKDRVTALLESLAPHRAYWPALDVPFRSYMVRLAAENASDYGEAADAWWADRVSEAANAAFEQACRALETESRGFRAAAEAAPRFRFFLSEALKPLRPESPAELIPGLVEVSP